MVFYAAVPQLNPPCVAFGQREYQESGEMTQRDLQQQCTARRSPRSGLCGKLHRWLAKGAIITYNRSAGLDSQVDCVAEQQGIARTGYEKLGCEIQHVHLRIG